MSASTSYIGDTGEGVDFIPLPLQGAWIPAAWMLQTYRKGGFHWENYPDTVIRAILGTTLSNHVQKDVWDICNKETRKGKEYSRETGEHRTNDRINWLCTLEKFIGKSEVSLSVHLTIAPWTQPYLLLDDYGGSGKKPDHFPGHREEFLIWYLFLKAISISTPKFIFSRLRFFK